MGKTSLQSFGDFRNVDLFYVLESGISEMKNIQREIVQIEFNDIDTHEMDMVFELKEMFLKQKEIEMGRQKSC